MRILPRATATVLALVFSGTLAGCTSMKVITPSGEPGAPVFGRVQAGDIVSVLTTDGRQHVFIVKSIEGESLISTEGVRYERAAIVELRRRSTNVAKTSLMVAGLAAGGFLALAFILFLTWN